MAKVNMNQGDFELILMSAVRYALGRQTYIVGTTTKAVLEELPNLSKNCICTIINDIIKANSSSGLGNKIIDEPMWVELLAKLRSELATRIKESDSEKDFYRELLVEEYS